MPTLNGIMVNVASLASRGRSRTIIRQTTSVSRLPAASNAASEPWLSTIKPIKAF
jgi:hypothetical protein